MVVEIIFKITVDNTKRFVIVMHSESEVIGTKFDRPL